MKNFDMNEDCKKITKDEWILFMLLAVAFPIGLAGIVVIAIAYLVFKSKSTVMRIMITLLLLMATYNVA